MNDELKKIESLEKRVSELESLKKSSLSMFGRSYSLTGSSNSDYLIKTKGQVKILWGNKFIDLIKDGKINVDSKFIFKEDSIGTKDGIYVVGEGEDTEIWLVVNGELINLKGEVGNTYVSFMAPQETTAENKTQALYNIGLIYPTISSVNETSLQNGVIYIEEEKKLYIVEDGVLKEFKFLIPNPITELIVIAKNDKLEGAVIIKGQGIENGLIFEKMAIYSDAFDNILDLLDSLKILLFDSEIITIDNSDVRVAVPVIGTMFQSPEANSNTGFRLYYLNGESTLEVDNLIVRNKKDGLTLVYSKYWTLSNNVISKVEKAESDTNLVVTLAYKNNYKVGDVLCFYTKLTTTDEEGESTTDNALLGIFATVVSTSEENSSIEILLLTKVEIDLDSLAQTIIFLVIDSENRLPVSISENIDLERNTTAEENINTEVVARFGNIGDLNLSISNGGSQEATQGYGIYSEKMLAKETAYISNYDLPEDDDSSKLASTEWVNKKLAASSTVTDIDLTMENTLEELDNDESILINYLGNKALKLVDELADETTMTYLCYNGVLTISKVGGVITYSAIVKAKTDSGTWSHRSINCTCSPLSYPEWKLLDTYIILDAFTPGYYWTTKFENQSPTSPTYIGTTNSETVSEAIPYIVYSNDGKVWKLIDQYVAPNENTIYFVASGLASCTLPDFLAVPMGFIGIVKKSDGVTPQVKVGKSNYAIDTFDKDIEETGDIRGNIPKATRELLIRTLEDALPGVVPSIPGLPVTFAISVADFLGLNESNTRIPERCMRILRSTEAGVDLPSIFGDSKIQLRDEFQTLCRWTNGVGSKDPDNKVPNHYASIGKIDFWKFDMNVKLLAGAILSLMLQSVPGIESFEAMKAIYSDTVGFAQAWTSTHWENFNFFQMKGVCESSFAPPTDDDLQAKAGLKMNNHLEIVCGPTHIFGNFNIIYRDYKWPDAPTNYLYLSYAFGIDSMDKVNIGARLPYPVTIEANLVFNSVDGNYKITGTIGKDYTATPL